MGRSYNIGTYAEKPRTVGVSEFLSGDRVSTDVVGIVCPSARWSAYLRKTASRKWMRRAELLPVLSGAYWKRPCPAVD